MKQRKSQVPAVSSQTFAFLKQLAINNNREWFQNHKQQYNDARENICTFIDQLIAEMNQHDVLETGTGKQCLYRIFRDIRFSKDKTPYNPRFAFSLKRATAARRGGYYMNIQPGHSVLAAGFYAPEPEDLKRIRQDVEMNVQEWKKILNLKQINVNFGSLQGEQLVTAPRGFPKDHPGIDLLRHKQFYLMHSFTDKEVLDPGFLYEANRLFKSVRPFFDYMSLVLTTDGNGEPLL